MNSNSRQIPYKHYTSLPALHGPEKIDWYTVISDSQDRGLDVVTCC